MRNIKLTIEYDGTNYNGWQRQKSGIGVEQVVEKAIKKVVHEEIELYGASRTDSGVHALGQVANFKTNSVMPIEKIPFALNSILPGDIVIRNAQEVSDDFHSRFSTTGKKYRYTILNDRYRSAFSRTTSYFVPSELDFEAMKKSCKYFIGTHDFDAFKSSGSSFKTTVRTIYSAELVKNENYIEFYISGGGFLYNMVRIIVGTLLNVGRGKIMPEEIEEIIQSKDRKRSGKTAPAHGLCLMEVYYQDFSIKS